MTVIVATKPQLKKMLEDQLVKAQAYDAQILAQHQAEIEKAWVTLKEKMQDALQTWSAQDAEKKYFRIDLDHRPLGCPRSMAVQYERALRDLSMDAREKFRISDSNEYHHLLSWDPDAKSEALC